MFYNNEIWVASAGDKKLSIIPKMANRHGLIAGATGTGKTVTLKVMAESFSDCGVPVFLGVAVEEIHRIPVLGNQIKMADNIAVAKIRQPC